MSDSAQHVTEFPAQLKKSVPWLYFIAMVAQMVGGTIAGAYLIFYITEKMLITAVIMGTIMLVSRIIDLVIGLFAGVIVQKISFKYGQYRSWLLYGPFVVAIGTTLCFFNPSIPIMAKAVIVLVGYVLYGGGMSFIQLSQNGLLAKIAGPNMNHRMTIAGRIVQGQNFGTILASAVTMPVIMLIEKTGADGYAIVQVIWAVIGLVGQLPLFFFTKEYDPYDPNYKTQGGASVKIGSMFAEVLKNGQLLILLFADMLRWAGMMGLMSLGVYYFSYVVKDMNWLTIALTTQSVVAFLASLVMPSVARKIGKKGSAICSGLLGVVFFVALAIWGAAGPVVYIVCLSGFMASQAIINSCGVNLYLDCGEYQLFKTGKDNRTFTMSMLGVAIKVGFVLSSVVVTLILEFSGYDGATASVANVGMMVLLLGGIPAGLNLLYTVLMLFYGITEEKSREYAAANAAKVAAA